MIILAPNNVVIKFDVLVKFEYKADVEVTKHAVEKRGKISDNTSKEPYEIDIEGLITDADVPGSSKTTYQQLNDIRGVLVTVVAGYDSYDDMTLVTLKEPQDEHTGESLRFNATFRHIDRVELQQTTVAVKSGKKSKGSQATIPANAPKTSAAREGLYSKFPGARAWTKGGRR